MSKLSSNDGVAVLRSRPPVRQREIEVELRKQIVDGLLAPAMRLPTRRELAEVYGASSRTVQDALDSLAADGFIESQGTRGTFVSDRPPHLSNYALVFGVPSRHNRFWSTLQNAFQHSGIRSLEFT